MTSTEPATSAAARRRPTRQRRAIAAVMETFDDFRSAQEIHGLLSRAGRAGRPLHGLPHPPGDGRRRRDRLAAHGVRREHLPPCSATHHHHLVCRSCGATVEVEGPAVEKWTRSVAAAHGYSDVSHTLEIFGTCGAC